jgi:hypothetical protein
VSVPTRPVAAAPESAELPDRSELEAKPELDVAALSATLRFLGWARRNRATVIGVAVGMLVALWLTADVWGARLPVGGDVTGHLIRAKAGDDLLRNGQLDGWSPRFGLGYQQSLFYGPGFGWLLLAVRLVTFGLLSSAGALKVVMIASVVAIPAATAFVAHSMGLGPRGAGVAAVLGLLASSPFGVGLHGLFENGLVPQQVGGVLFLVALGATIRVLNGSGEPSQRINGWQVLLTLTLAAIVITHLITLAILGLFVACVLVAMAISRTLTWSGVGRLAVCAAGAAGVSAFWVLPFLAHHNLHGPVATWSTPPFGTRVADILSGRVLYQPLAAKAVLVGIAYGFIRVGQRRPFALLMVLAPIVALAIGHWSIHAVPNELTLQLANRELGLAGILLVLPLAAAIEALMDAIDPVSWLTLGAGLAGSVYLVVAPWGNVGQLARQADPVVPEMRAAAAELRRIVAPSARFVTVRNYPSEVTRTGTLQPDRWLAWASGRNTLNTFPVEVSSTPVASSIVDRLVNSEPPSQSASDLARYGVTHVVATSAEQVATLTRSSRFRPVWGTGTMTILSVLPDPAAGTASPASQISIASGPLPGRATSGDGRLRIDTASPSRTLATVALAWSPKWHARVNGKTVALQRTPDGLVALILPGGEAHVDLSFRHDGWDVAGLTLTLLSLLALVWLTGRESSFLSQK